MIENVHEFNIGNVKKKYYRKQQILSIDLASTNCEPADRKLLSVMVMNLKTEQTVIRSEQNSHKKWELWTAKQRLKKEKWQ